MTGVEAQTDDPEDSTEQRRPLEPPELWHFTIDQTISGDLAPRVRILVFMVTEDGEVVADTVDLDIVHCFENSVSYILSVFFDLLARSYFYYDDITICF